MSSGPTGFYKTPVSKAFVGIVAAASLLSISSATIHSQWLLTHQALFVEGQLWRLVPTSVAFNSLPELLFGLYLLYFFRLFERQQGSSKYAVFVLFSCVFSTILEALLLWVLPSPSHHGEIDGAMEDQIVPSGASWLPNHLLTSASPSPGPYGLIFAFFVLYALDVPPTSRFTLFSHLQFSDKALVYVAGLQLLLCSWWQSMLPGLCGIISGILFRCNICGIRKAKMPVAVTNAAQHYLAFVQSAPPDAPTTARGGGGGAALRPAPTVASASGASEAYAAASALGGLGRSSASRSLRSQATDGPAPTAPSAHTGFSQNVIPASQEAVDQLLAMGFDRDSAMQALAHAGNDLTLATNILLES